MGINKLFDISRRSLLEYQRALGITSHNIANANNPNYSRQRVLLGTEHPDITANFVWGSGMKIEDIQRVRSGITDTQIRLNNQKYYDSSRRSDMLTHIESIFSEPSELGLSNLINSFFNSWDELAVNPTSNALRTSVVNSAQRVASRIKDIYEGLQGLRSDVRTEATEKVKSLNTLLEQIQVLNKQIYESTVTGVEANDLLDERDALIDELSQQANINVTIDKDNVANISIAGVFAVDKAFVNKFKVVEENGSLLIKTQNEDAELTLNGGELYSLTDFYSNKINSYQEGIDQVATLLMNSVNEVHRSGYSMMNPPDNTGIDFFSSYSNGKLDINQNILVNNNYISASEDGSNGNGSLAARIAGLKDKKHDNGYTVSETYSNLITDIANYKSLNDQNTESFGLVLDQLHQQKASVSGVSIDEEMVNVLKFQRSYDAAAKLIKTADEMLLTILEMV